MKIWRRHDDYEDVTMTSSLWRHIDEYPSQGGPNLRRPQFFERKQLQYPHVLANTLAFIKKCLNNTLWRHKLLKSTNWGPSPRFRWKSPPPVTPWHYFDVHRVFTLLNIFLCIRVSVSYFEDIILMYIKYSLYWIYFDVLEYQFHILKIYAHFFISPVFSLATSMSGMWALLPFLIRPA